jgi:hypothetical protein
MPPRAPYLEGARLLIAADCVPFAFRDFHARFLDGRVALVGCPKLDDAAFYEVKLAALLRDNDIREIEVVIMEVPCCGGLARLVSKAVAEAGKAIPVNLSRIGVHGELLDARTLP